MVRTVAGGRRLNPHSPSATTPTRTVTVMMTEYETQSTLYLKKVELYPYRAYLMMLYPDSGD